MKTSFFSGRIILVLVMAFFLSEKAFSYGEWDLIDANSGVSVFERWVYVNKDLTVRERKGEFSVPGTLSSVVKIVSDVSLSKQWMEHVSDAYLVSRLSEKVWYTYTYFSLPWPFANRDMVAMWMLGYSSDNKTATIEIRSRENMIPEKKGIKRLGNYSATWIITDKGSNNIGVSFSTISYTSPEFPRVIQDPVLRSTFMQNMKNLQRLLFK
ncbi:MAG: hypothetical protein CVU11_08560 [Bacteroidetes bacterium HGW-Bacteroidetes-6]|jgi:hypothetical protein|nr:MAG: hypothetical protein CVU11_08560 [Bacteroidetes bacterium HGW-Bacteroidetes-6]